MKFFTAVSALMTAIAAVSALPVADIKLRDVFAPPILTPTAGTVWTAGERVTVTWDLSDVPTQITNPIGNIRLRRDGWTSPFLLADDFQITDGSVEFTVPRVVEGNDYQLVLFGNSGNWSPEITITGTGVFY
ncbi:hypothetical protein CVT24_000670 [Panaeolus cyanescens]|uniref:Yeast cell wall synthesis Kre9/Knh1-like N-terminal domain-containing protein n=1 Tax=Panaeolus cyanescens TaxID=181874 RepID=A0A409VWL5_9AGAR|nr:hypothetical protein CVT24_000670 [Panaeolus cyanescens]